MPSRNGSFFLLKPFGNVVLGPEEIDGEADPAGSKHQYTADDFSHQRDGLLDDVDYCQNGQYQTDEINNCSHNTNMRKNPEHAKSDGLTDFFLNL